ncbi:MAG: ABC-2 family transporter protein [candidate division SR1 bacterium]|nr:ABC-2 family transporter protein [candidate division SR1 bacterium]
MFKLLFHIRKLNILSALAYRVSFLIQVVSMIINDAIMLVLFYFFFSKFGTIGGMDFQGYIRLLVVILGGFSFMHICLYGSRKIGEMVMNGSLDAHLLLPKNILLRILVGGLSITAIGDLLYGIGLLFLIKNLTVIFVLKVIFVSICAGIVFAGFMVAFESLAFWIGSSRELSRGIFEAILGPSHYPSGIFKGMIFKVMFMTIIPVFFVAYLPYDIVSSEFTLRKILLLLGATIFFGGLGTFVFYRGLRKYESGNMMNINL